MIKYFLIYASAVLISSVSQILLKCGARKQYGSVIKEYLNPWVIGGYFLFALTTVLTMIAYTKLDYKNGPVIESAGYILIMLLSATFFREKITLRKVIGNLIIITGIIVFYI